MNWRFLAVGLLLLFVLPGCTPRPPDAPSPITPVSPPPSSPPSESTDRISPLERVPRISMEELLQKIKSKETMLLIDSRVDVTEVFSKGHIEGAIPVPLARIISGEWTPPPDKNTEIIIYCT